jgi:2-polyprenyl-3-methyl-5-hydroxy-6-metoxy-1,4-benzoquinol methylase
VKKVLCPTKLQAARKRFSKEPIKVLDVGCGNRSCEIARHWLNIKEYVGVDREYWHGDKDGYEAIDRMVFTDLDVDPTLAEVEEGAFDLIILNHVIEHLRNGEAVLAGLHRKLRPGGMIYVETPDIATLNYPSAIGFLNFYDDPTHQRVYEVRALVAEMMRIGFVVNRFGRRRDWRRMALFAMPMLAFNLLYSIPIKNSLDARGLWDLFGVASFVIATRK